MFICTTDKDCRQLIGDRVQLYNLRKKESMDRAGLLKDWGVAPEQVVDLQALVGDSVDNVPGVPGIGLKTAAKLLQEFGTLDNILANIDRSGPGCEKDRMSLRLRLSLAGKVADLSRQLVRLARMCRWTWTGKAGSCATRMSARLLALFQEWGFHRFADQVRALAACRNPGPVAQPGLA